MRLVAGATRLLAPVDAPKEFSLTTSPDSRFTKPLYSVSEAAAYVGVPRSTFDTWARGYERRPRGRRPVHGERLLTTTGERGLTIPFVGLAEGMVLAAFRETGLPMQRIRPALERLRQENELHHALASQQLYTDGADVVYDYARAHGDKQLRLLTVVSSGQRVFHEVIDRYLRRITYGRTVSRLDSCCPSPRVSCSKSIPSALSGSRSFCTAEPVSSMCETECWPASR
jgi:hypothetical protein